MAHNHTVAPTVLPTLTLGQKVDGTMTFDAGVPTDGAVASDNPSVATIALAADGVSWHIDTLSVGSASMAYTGTSVPPDAGPVVVPNIFVTVSAAPVAETGSFNDDSAVITGP